MSKISNIKKIDRKTAQLAVSLTDAELRFLGVNLAAVCQDIDQLETRRTELALIIGRRKEIRDVEVECRLNFNTNRYGEVRLDTSEIIYFRPLTEDDIRLK